MVDGRDWATESFDVARQQLSEWRESQARHSEEVVEAWEHVLSRTPSALGDELWPVYEQVCIAALDCARAEVFQECISELDARFPRSNRVLRLHAMRYESTEQFNAAVDIYERLIEADPTNNGARKRKVAVLMAQGKRLDAIRELNEYLKVFLNDQEAWLQLGELFLAEADYAKAAHALEECVLGAPLNSVYLRRLADIRYTQGGQDNIELARSYYEQAAKLNPSDARALYGLVLTGTYLATQTKLPSDQRKEASASGCAAAEKLAQRYEEASEEGSNPAIPDILSALEKMKEQCVAK